MSWTQSVATRPMPRGAYTHNTDKIHKILHLDDYSNTQSVI